MTNKKYLFYACLNYSFAILRPLQEEIKKRGDEVKWFLGSKKINANYLKADEERLLTIKDVIDYNADATFIPGNNVPSFLPGLKVAVFHGFNVEKRPNAKGHFNIRGCFDLYCTQGPNTTETFSKLSQEKKFFSIKETGWPAIDPLFQNNHLHQTTKPTILFCSTFSTRLSCAEELFETIKKLSLSGKYNWLVQFHPKMSNTTIQKYKSIQNEYLTFIETDDIIPLLKKADVMVCDTSSVITMFLMLSKPVVTFKNAKPKPHMINITHEKDLEKNIDLALSRPLALMNNIELFKKETHPYSDGKSSLRVLKAVDELLDGSNLPSKRKPLNLVRQFKMRKKFNYWRF